MANKSYEKGESKWKVLRDRHKLEAIVRRWKESEKVKQNYQRFRLSSATADIKPNYDVVVIGSGYGASIAASRAARAGQSVCVLEKGREWLPGDFPENDVGALTETQMTIEGPTMNLGDSSKLFDLRIGKDVAVLQGCGLGGGSLINASVGLDCDERVFQDEVWPSALRKEMRASSCSQDRDRVYEMLKPQVYPDDFPKLNKMAAMEEAAKSIVPDIEDLGTVLKKAPLYVNFKDTARNHVGIPQPACVGCGNCCGGCNTGAKNSLNMNYLPDAKAFGAEIYTKVEVTNLKRYHGKWTVYYKPVEQQKSRFEAKQLFIHAGTVILGAGSLGSTGILLRSRKFRNLECSSKLGARFSTNGDSLNFSYNGEHPINPTGVKLENLTDDNRPGPAIVRYIDLRKEEGESFDEGIMMEDGTPPCSSELAYKLVVNWIEKGEPTTEAKRGDWRETAGRLAGRGFKNTLCFLSMGHDDATGKLVLDEKSDAVLPHYPDIGMHNNFTKIHGTARTAVEGLKGELIQNPFRGGVFAAARDVKGVITVHPLGGCGMGESGREGVVNHAGQVFRGDTDELYPGLYVVDGAIMPRSLGANPTLTICILAERCMRLMAEQKGWIIDYTAVKPLKPSRTAPTKGIRFTERMAGSMHLVNEKKDVDCEFLLTIESPDVKKMLHDDEGHFATVYGTVSCEAIATSPMSVSGGKFRFLNRSQSRVGTRKMVYELPIHTSVGEELLFRGVKHIHKDSVLEIGIEDTTTLSVSMYKRRRGDFTDNENGQQLLDLIGNGKLHIHLQDFIKQMLTLEVFNTKVFNEKIRISIAFAWHFVRALWHVYSPFRKMDRHDPANSIYAERPLNLKEPTAQKLVTPDQVEIEVRRYQGGMKGPILLVHGTGVTSEMFYFDTTEQNLVEFLVEREYDVWTLDWRASLFMEASRTQFNVDQAARYDVPTAVGYILRITGHEDIQVLVHCAGAILFFTSLLQGNLRGKIRSIISSQTGPCVIPGKFNDIRSRLQVATHLKKIGVVGLSSYTDINDGLYDKLINSVARINAAISTDTKEHCNNPVCHRITLTYHMLWNHSNLNKDTHDKLHKIFGYVNSTVLEHFAKTINTGHVVTAEGRDLYLPGLVDSENRLSFESYRGQMKLLDIPTLFCSGQDNVCWDPETSRKSFEICKEGNPHQHYERILFDGYGHFDCLIGKDCHKHVFPQFLTFLDKYALPNSNA